MHLRRSTSHAAPMERSAPPSRQPSRRLGRGSRFALGLALVGSIGLVGCGSDDGGGAASSGGDAASGSGAAPTGAPFKVGIVMPLSGQFAPLGTGGVAGMQVAADKINAEGGILGRQVELVPKDSAGDPARGLAAARELVEKDKVDFLMPDVFPNVTLAIMQYTTEKKLVTITPSGAPGMADPKYPYSFQVGPGFNAYTDGMVDQFEGIGAKKIGMLVANNPGGLAQADIWKSGFAKAGLDIVDQQTFDDKATDVTPILQNLKSSGAEALAFFGTGAQTGVIMSGVRDLGWDVQVVASNAAVTGDLSAAVPADVVSQFRAVCLRILGRSGTGVDPQFKPFVDALKAKNAATSLSASAGQYDTLLLVKWAFEKAGSTDHDAIKAALETTAANPPTELEFLQSPPPEYTATVHDLQALALSSDRTAVVKASQPVDGTFEILKP